MPMSTIKGLARDLNCYELAIVPEAVRAHEVSHLAHAVGLRLCEGRDADRRLDHGHVCPSS